MGAVDWIWWAVGDLLGYTLGGILPTVCYWGCVRYHGPPDHPSTLQSFVFTSVMMGEAGVTTIPSRLLYFDDGEEARGMVVMAVPGVGAGMRWSQPEFKTTAAPYGSIVWYAHTAVSACRI